MYRGNILELGEADEIYNNPIHPYTKSLLSAVPQPNPDYERKRVRIPYKHEEVAGKCRSIRSTSRSFRTCYERTIKKLDQCLIL